MEAPFMISGNIIAQLKLAVAKKAAKKLGDIYKTIPIGKGTSSATSLKPVAPSPSKSLSPINAGPGKSGTPNSLSGMDLMAPPITANGLKTPGAAFSDGLASGAQSGAKAT